jgi:hypothetical protein
MKAFELPNRMSERPPKALCFGWAEAGRPKICVRFRKTVCEFGQLYSVVAYRVLCDVQDRVLTIVVLQIGNRRLGD